MEHGIVLRKIGFQDLDRPSSEALIYQLTEINTETQKGTVVGLFQYLCQGPFVNRGGLDFLSRGFDLPKENFQEYKEKEKEVSNLKSFKAPSVFFG
jgi:hypothetical protein